MKGPQALLLNVLWLVGCGFTPSLIGARWGERPAVVAARLGSTCKEWQTWGQSGFEACTADSAAPIKVLGGAADMTLIRRGDELEAVMLSFRECSTQREALTAAVRRELATAPDDGMDPYEVSLDGSLLRFDRRDCKLTLAAPRFAKVFASELLGQGLGGLFRVR